MWARTDDRRPELRTRQQERGGRNRDDTGHKALSGWALCPVISCDNRLSLLLAMRMAGVTSPAESPLGMVGNSAQRVLTKARGQEEGSVGGPRPDTMRVVTTL